MSASITGLVLFLFAAGAFFDTLEAYSLAFIPLPWAATIFYLAAALIPVLLTGKLTMPNGTWLIFLYLLWSILALSLYLAANGLPIMPDLATTSFPVYLTLRFLSVAVFVAVVVVCYWLVRRGALEKIIRIQIALLMFVSMAALYIYAAQTFGFWEPPRNRMGTGGQDFLSQDVVFTFAFHRALGTFLEPSHLAEWIAGVVIFLLPVMTLCVRPLAKWAIIFLAFAAIALSGSLLGVLSLTAGFLALLILQKGWRQLVNLTVSLAAIVFIIVIANAALGIDIVGSVAPRIVEITEGGIGATNRAYIYYNLSDVPLTFLGYGLGVGPILASAAMGSDFVVAILNLFLSVTYDAGLVGLICISIYFSLPFVLAFRLGIFGTPLVAGCLASHVTWIVAYLGRSPELSATHAVPIGILMAVLYLVKSNPVWLRNSVMTRQQRHLPRHPAGRTHSPQPDESGLSI
jgi:hypothetical protein